MKATIKKITPSSIVILYRKISNYLRLKKLSSNDLNRFYKHASLFTESDYTENQIKYRLIYATHGIEKGLSHSELRLGFGKEQLIYINELLDEYNELGISKNDCAYQDTISVLSEYLKIHEKHNYDIKYFENTYRKYYLEIKKNNLENAGVIFKKANDKKANVDFLQLAKNRYSVREFDSRDVSNELINNAVEMSLKTPSACNRQMWKIRAIKNQDKIKNALNYQRGFSGYDIPPVLFLVTVSLESFQFPRERNEPFVDGGMFAMSILYSLEYLGLAACALNSELTLEDEESIRKILSISSSEVMIMFIAAGHFKEDYIVCKSPRLPTENILTIVEG